MARGTVRESAGVDLERAVHRLQGAVDVRVGVRVADDQRRHDHAAADRLLQEERAEVLGGPAALIAVLRTKALSSMLEHADSIERLLEQHAPDEAVITLNLIDDVFLRSYNWARWQLGIPLPD